MKRIILMRHAKYDWRQAGSDDHLCPLSAEGRRDALQMGALLQEEGVRLDAIFCSTAQRTRETLALFLKEYSFSGEPRYFDLLYHADIRDYVDIFMQLSPEVEAAMLIGHNPTISGALEFFADTYKVFSPAAIAYLEFDIEQWGELIEKPDGKLLGFWTPKKG